MYMNDGTRWSNTQIRDDGGEESIAFLGKTQLAATSLCSLPSSRNGENATAEYRETNSITFLLRRKSEKYTVLGKVTFKSNALQYCVTP